MPDPVNYLAGMQGPADGNFLKSLQGGIQMGLQAPSALEQEKQREDINLSRVQQNVYQQKLDEEHQMQEGRKKASDYYMQVLQDPSATPEHLQRAEDAVSYVNPEFGKIKEATRKNTSELISGFGKESSFGLYNAIRSKNTELINSEFDRYQKAAESRTELKIPAQVIKNLRETYDKNPDLALGIIRNAAFSADPTGYKKLWEAEAEQQKVEGGGAEELPLKDKNQFIEDQRKTWEKIIAPYNIRQDYNAIIKEAANDKIGDTARIKAFVKMVTPNESVMEGDVRSVSGMADTVGGFLENIQRKMSTTGLLDEKDRDAIARESQSLFDRSKGKVESAQKNMTPLLVRNKVNPADVFIFDMGNNDEAPKKDPTPKPNLTPYDPNNQKPVATYGDRADGTPKGEGWLGALKMKDGSDKFATELSVGVNINGKETEIPTLIPTLNKTEIDYLLKGGDPRKNKAIMDKAVAHAGKLIKKGSSPFLADSMLPGGGGEEVGAPSLIPLMTPSGKQFTRIK